MKNNFLDWFIGIFICLTALPCLMAVMRVLSTMVDDVSPITMIPCLIIAFTLVLSFVIIVSPINQTLTAILSAILMSLFSFLYFPLLIGLIILSAIIIYIFLRNKETLNIEKWVSFLKQRTAKNLLIIDWILCLIISVASMYGSFFIANKAMAQIVSSFPLFEIVSLFGFYFLFALLAISLVGGYVRKAVVGIICFIGNALLFDDALFFTGIIFWGIFLATLCGIYLEWRAIKARDTDESS